MISIRTLDTGSTTPLGNTIVLTSACTDASLVEHVAYYDDVLTQVSSGTLPGYRYQRVVLAELDDGPGPDVVGVVDDGRGYVVWPSGLSAPPWAVEHARAVRDLAVTDLDSANRLQARRNRPRPFAS